MAHRIAAVFIAALFLSAGRLNAEDAAGAGANDCSSLVVLYDGGGEAMRGDLMLATGQWALGYMTGLNARVTESERRDLGGFDSQTLGEDVLAACRAAPNEKILDVVTAMYWDAPLHQPGSA